MRVQKLVIHHSASKNTTTKADIEKWHKQRGFTQIGYHKVIEGNGDIVDGRPETTKGAHVKGANHSSLGVCVIGNFEDNSPTTAQINSLITVLTDWCNTHKLKAASIYGHFNVPGGSTETSCPGKNLKSQITLIKQKVTQKLK